MIELERFKLNIAEIIIGVDCRDRPWRLAGDSPLTGFIYNGNREPDLNLTITYAGIPDISLCTKVFDSGGVWRLFEDSSNFIISLTMPGSGDKPYKVGVIEKSFRTGTIYMDDSDARIRPLSPIEYPLDEWLL